MPSPYSTPRPVQSIDCSGTTRRVPRSLSYDQPFASIDHHIVSPRQGPSSFPIHTRLPSDTYPSSPSSDHPVSPSSTYSALSWSGSSNTQDHSSPVTPQFSYSPDTTITSFGDTPISAFLSEFYDPDSKSGSPAHSLVRLSGGHVHRLDFFPQRDEECMRNKRFCIVGNTSPPLPDEINMHSPKKTSFTTPVSEPSAIASRPTSLDIRKSRRFCRDFGEPFRSNDIIDDEFPIDTTKNSPMIHSRSSPTFPPDHNLLPPPSRSEVCNLFSEDETAAVRDFLRVWGSNNGVDVSQSNMALCEDVPDSYSDDDYSWEALELEDVIGDPTPCSLLLHEVSKMVGLPLEQSTTEDPASSASTPLGLDPLGRLTQYSHGLSQSLHLSSRIFSDSDDASVVDQRSSSVESLVDEPLDVAPQTAAASSWLVEGNTIMDKDQVSRESMDVPVILATSPAFVEPSCDLVLRRQLSPGRARSTDSNLRRRGQIFNVEETRILAASSGTLDLDVDRSYIATRDPPPLPPLPAPSAKRVSALDRLESSLSRLKMHGSHQRKSSSMDKANIRKDAASEDRGPPPSTALRERKHQSNANASIPDSRPAHGRHLSSHTDDEAPECHDTPQAETDPINARMQERAAKLFPYPENQEVTMRSFMEMDVAPPKVPPRRTSKLGRVAARWSQGITHLGKNFTGSSAKDSG